MYILKQSTAITVPFFAFDSNGDGVTGIADGSWTKRISKDGAAFGAMTVTITEMENGWYSIPLSTSHTDTLGFLSISLSAAGVKRVNLQWRVFARLLDDLAFPNTSGRGMDIDATGGVEITPNQDVNAAQWAGVATATDDVALSTAPTNFSALSITAGGLVDITQAAADKVWLSATRTLTAFNTALAVSVWDVLETDIAAASSIGLKVKTNLDSTVSSRASQISVDTIDDFLDTEIAAILEDTGTTIPAQITALNNLSAAQVNTEVDTALADIRLDELLAADSDIDGAAPPTVGSVIHELMSKSAASFTYDQTTDSLEAIRDKETDIETGTQDIQARLPAALVSGRMDSNVGAMAANTMTASALAADAVTEIQSGLATSAEIAALPTATENADELLKRDMSLVTGEASRSPLNALRFLRNKWAVSGTTVTVTKEDDTTTAWTGTVTTDAAAAPITGVDPS